MQRLAELPRPRVPYRPEVFDGGFCLWRTGATGAHTDNLRLDPVSRVPVLDVLRMAMASQLRSRGGHLLVQTLEGGTAHDDAALLDHLAAGGKATGYIMGRSLAHVHDEPAPELRNSLDYQVRVPASRADYLALRRLAADIFGGGSATYDPETDFYSALDTMTYLGVFERGQVIATASILIVDGVANIWSVCTREEARGRGAASVVTHASLLEACRQGACSAVLGTSLDLAKPGGLYSRLGFETIGHEYNWMLTGFDEAELA